MKDLIGIIGQYGCLFMMSGGLAYEIVAGAHFGWAMFTVGAIGAMVFTKVRGK